MSFFRITNPEKRDAMVADYTATMKRLKERNFAERVGDSYRRREFQEQWEPVIRSNEKVAENLIKDLKPIKQEMEELNKAVKHEDHASYFQEFKARVLSRDPEVDTSFGIYFVDDGSLRMGNETVTIDRYDDITVGKEVYYGSKGLWKLNTDTTENQIGYADHDYTRGELLEYIKLVNQTHVLHQDFDPKNPYPRANSSWKWKHLLRPIWDSLKQKSKEEEPSGSGLCKAYIQKGGHCYRLHTVEGDGLLLNPRPRLRTVGDGLFLKQGHNVYDGEGLLLGPHSPFKNIPILGWIL